MIKLKKIPLRLILVVPFTFQILVTVVLVQWLSWQIDIPSEITEASSLRILLAEDNLVNQKLAIFFLQKLGYSADIANNGREVLEILKHQTCDLILMDMQMPEIDGISATTVIRQELKIQP